MFAGVVATNGLQTVANLIVFIDIDELRVKTFVFGLVTAFAFRPSPATGSLISCNLRVWLRRNAGGSINSDKQLSGENLLSQQSVNLQVLSHSIPESQYRNPFVDGTKTH